MINQNTPRKKLLPLLAQSSLYYLFHIMSTNKKTPKQNLSFWRVYKSEFKVAVVVTCITTLFALAGGNFIMGLFSPISGNSDFQFSDLYCKIAYNLADNPNSSDITIIATDSLTDREQLAKAINFIDQFEPKLLGVDIHFAEPQDSTIDAKLIDALNNFSGGLVLPSYLYEDEYGQIQEGDRTFMSEYLHNAKYGSTNYSLNSNWGPTRIFETMVYGKDGAYVPFATVIAQMANSTNYEELLARNLRLERQWEYINYVSSPDFDCRILTLQDIQDQTTHAEYEGLIKDRIVLFGDIYNSNDMQTTPYDKSVPGIYIHAHSLDTILSEAYYQEVSKTLLYIISILCCLLFTSFSLAMKAYKPDLSGLIIRLSQAILMFMLYWIGCELYIQQIYFDPVTLLLMLVAIPFTTDIYFGARSLAKNIIKKIKEK